MYGGYDNDELKQERADLLKDMKSFNRKALFAEYVGGGMVLLPSLMLLGIGDSAISLSTAVGFIGVGLLLYLTAIRYFLVAATMSARRLADLTWTRD